MILVTGATGKTGSAVLQSLLKRGAPVRALIHSAERAAKLPEGVESRVADYADRASLDAALEGVDHAYLVSPPAEHATDWQTQFVQAAKAAGVSHVVKLSILGAGRDAPSRFQRSHGEIEQAIEASGIGWTHLRPNFFMQTVMQYLQGDVLFAIGQESNISLVDYQDLAEVAAVALTESGHEGKIYEITGPAVVSTSEIAQGLSNALGRTVAPQVLPFDVSAAVMGQSGFPEWNIEGIIELSRWFHSGAASVVTDAVQRVAKRAPRSFEEFACEHARSGT